MNFDSGRIRTRGGRPPLSKAKSSCVYDHSLPHSRLATAGWPPVTWKGSGAHVPLSIQASRSNPCSRLLPDYASDPLAGPAGRRDFWGCMIISSLINVLEIISALPLST
ncbi:unnamed protein product [Spirodela intermedia]|uniref:Uncharacterized protein n=1 Tax=Spirodela intermedia TaxID=51605 RepID=A0A7I8LK14_SPIIN|nr:unnamed protein product [Spirodela intermedia]